MVTIHTQIPTVTNLNKVVPIYSVVSITVSLVPCLFVLLRVDEQATEDPGVQQVEVAE
jgi:hypothetical protein